MLESITHFIEFSLLPLGGWGVFLASIIEEVVFFVPSSLVQLSSGFLFLGDSPVSLSSLGYLLVVVSIPCALGIALGSLFTYAIGYYGGKPVVEKFGPFFGIRWSDIERLHARFKSSYKDEFAVATLRIIPVVPAVTINVLAGIIRMPLVSYLVTTFLASIPRVFMVAFFGWQAAYVYTKYISYFQNVGYIIAGIIVVYLVYRFRHRLFGRWRRK